MEDISVNFVDEKRKLEEEKPVEEDKVDTIKRKKKLHLKKAQVEDRYLKSLEDTTEKAAPRDIFSLTRFEELPICDKLKSSLKENSYSHMTLIQQRAIPAILSNQYVLVKSETGSGKTFAYLVPILQKLYELSIKQEGAQIKRDKGAYVLIFSPTRELATQIYESCLKLTKRLTFIVCGALMGGESVKREKARLRKGLNVIIATPGRLLYHLQHTTSMNLSNLQYIVCDKRLMIGV